MSTVNAIVFLHNKNIRGNTEMKYRTIKDLGKFERFLMIKFSDNLKCINYYNKDTREFIRQVKF